MTNEKDCIKVPDDVEQVGIWTSSKNLESRECKLEQSYKMHSKTIDLPF
jgi:hypothetical protein